MTFILDQIKKADEITTDLKKQILYGYNEPHVQFMKRKIIEAQVCIHSALHEMEFQKATKQRIKAEFLFMSIITLMWISLLLHIGLRCS